MAYETNIKEENLIILGAKEHNLQNVSLTIPGKSFVVITGLSGSGKSSLAFDTIYAEGQRRFLETLSPYARKFIGEMQRPAVDKITGLNPVIAIEQKTISRSPRSTVGTITEIYDFLRLLYARVATAYSYVTNEKMVKYTENQVEQLIKDKYKGQEISLFAPIAKGKKGHFREVFEQIQRWGFLQVRVDGELKELTQRMQVDRYKAHSIEIKIDKLVVGSQSEQRLVNSIKTALKYGKGSLMIQTSNDNTIANYSKYLMCPTSGISYQDPEPNLFSFNSPFGACPHCNGLGTVVMANIEKIIPNPKLSINDGGIAPLGKKTASPIFKQLEYIAQRYNFSLDEPIANIDESSVNLIMYGTSEPITMKNASGLTYGVNYEGIANFIAQNSGDDAPANIRKWAQQFMHLKTCDVCNGGRLKKEATYFRIDNKSIVDIANMDIASLQQWMFHINDYLSAQQMLIAKDIVQEINKKLKCLLDLGIDYLTLNRSSQTLSGGEAQRLRLATQISSNLVNVLYILDEPSIGLHQRDNQKLIHALQALKNAGNAVMVVEHDYDTMKAADYIVDIGPGAGLNGGKIMAEGTFEQICQAHSLTGDYLSGRKTIEVSVQRRKANNGKKLVLKGAKGNNLKNLTVNFPLGVFICVTGVSGSGKSSLINGTLYPILSNAFYHSDKNVLPYDSIEGLQYIDKVIEINQQPIGRIPRSNPATYIGVFDLIRNFYSTLPEAKIRNYKPGRFSFNVSGGRCEACKGAGVKTIEMNFLPEVYVHCDTCNGKRYNKETLEIRYKGKSINDVLEMTFDEALVFFENIPSIVEKLKMVVNVGLGYLHLGQKSTTLSGGEAQRIKLATELSKKDTGNTFYILDEPTTGLHFEDIRILLSVLNKLVDKGNTVLVVEHNMDVIKTADWIIDMGPEGGSAGGGNIVAQGTPNDIVKRKVGYTAKFLKEYINIDK